MDLSRWVWKKKERDWRGADLTLVAPSTWMAERVRLSRLFRNTPVKVIPNGLDLSVYRPIDRHTARDILNLPHDRQIILSGGAMRFFESPYKGATQLQGCLERLACQSTDLLLFGTSMPPKPLSSSFTIRYVGTIHDDVTLALYYSASDVFVCSSIAENLSCTVMESLACGTPVVAFDIGGMSDMIEHKINGYLAHPLDTDDLARGVSWVIGDYSRNRRLSDGARSKVEENYSLDKVARRYAQLYEDILKRMRLGVPQSAVEG
jgi:glycosyltransferase involved in cell wall biosynthesis